MVVISVLYALGPTAVLFGKHIDKRDADKAKGVRSLPVLLGEELSRRVVCVLLVGQYLLVLVLLGLGELTWPVLLVFANAYVARRTIAVMCASSPSARPESFPDEVWPLWYAAFTFDHTRRFSAWFMLGLLLEIALLT